MLKTGDPFMLFIIPTERFLTETTTATLIHGAWNHYLNIVLPDSALKTLRIDGTFAGLNGVYPSGIKLLHATKLPAVKMTVLTLQIHEGRHLVQCGSPIGIYSYGFGVTGDEAYDSYGHNCGMRLDP
jgi:hypothetical protein